MVFSPVVTYGCESWTIKKAGCGRTDAFKLWYCRRRLRALWTARRWNQSILKEINPGYSLEGLMMKLELQHFGHLMWKTYSLEKTLILGKTEGRRRRKRRDGWMASPTQWTWVWASPGRWWRTGKPRLLQSMGSQRVRCDQATEQEEEDSDAQRSLVHCSAKGCNELDTTLQLSNNLLLTLLSPAAFHYIYFWIEEAYFMHDFSLVPQLFVLIMDRRPCSFSVTVFV